MSTASLRTVMASYCWHRHPKPFVTSTGASSTSRSYYAPAIASSLANTTSSASITPVNHANASLNHAHSHQPPMTHPYADNFSRNQINEMIYLLIFVIKRLGSRDARVNRECRLEFCANRALGETRH